MIRQRNVPIVLIVDDSDMNVQCELIEPNDDVHVMMMKHKDVVLVVVLQQQHHQGFERVQVAIVIVH